MASQIGSISNWYTSSYSGPFSRTSRLRAPSLLPTSRFSISNPQPQVPIQQTLVVDAARQPNHTETKDDSKNLRRRETIFGPDVGEDDEPGWTLGNGEKEDAKVGVEVVKSWVERAKSEEGLHATTTLQALVNLKRPTLLLQPVEASPPVLGLPNTTSTPTEGKSEITPAPPASLRAGSTATVQPPPLHLLKFNYDATTPLVNVTLSVHPTPQLAVDGVEPILEQPKVVYTGIHPGAFNQVFTLPVEAALDLSSAIAPMPVPEEAIEDDEDAKSAANVPAPPRETNSEDTNRSSIDQGMAGLQVSGSTRPDLSAIPEVANGATQETNEVRPARRFGIFGRRNQERDVEAGQIEMTGINGNNEGEEEKKDEVKEIEKGLRVLIKIEAVGPEGQTLKRRNAQLTHILINGMWVPDAGATAAGQAGKRVWVIKVVRREAIIGAHTFLLKEIYGLSSANNSQAPPQTSYPPATSGTEPAIDPYASTPNECIVCLTSPRDVVLLPCRHLVVCRECAVGMVEFGAGGKVGRRDDSAAAAGTTGTEEAGTNATGAGNNGTTTTPTPAPATTTTGRRKKKAKGWFCPVCRQPYTSLLRLALPTTSKTPTSHVSRAPSIRSVRSTNTLRRVPSLAPTLPDGAERMLDSLRPEVDDEEDEVEIEPVHSHIHGGHTHAHGEMDLEQGLNRPQFVLGPEVDIDDEETKREVEHREVAVASASVKADVQAEAQAEAEIKQKAKEGESANVKL